MAKKTNSRPPKTVETLTHDEAKRKNIPTAEYQSVVRRRSRAQVRLQYAAQYATSIRSSSGAARMSRTGAISSSTRRRSTSRRRSIPRC